MQKRTDLTLWVDGNSDTGTHCESNDTDRDIRRKEAAHIPHLVRGDAQMFKTSGLTGPEVGREFDKIHVFAVDLTTFTRNWKFSVFNRIKSFNGKSITYTPAHTHRHARAHSHRLPHGANLLKFPNTMFAFWHLHFGLKIFFRRQTD